MVYTYCLTNGFYTRYTMMVRTNTLIPNINKKDTLMNSTSLAIKKKKHLLSNYYLPNDRTFEPASQGKLNFCYLYMCEGGYRCFSKSPSNLHR